MREGMSVIVESSVSKAQLNLIQSVERAIALLQTLGETDSGQSLTQVAQRLDLHPSTAHRLLATLVAHDLAIQAADSKAYQLGPALIGLGEAAMAQNSIIVAAQGVLADLASKTGELVNLVIPHADQIMYVHQAQGKPQGAVRMFTRIGAMAPLYCSGAGKAILAHLPQEDQERIIGQGLPAFTEKTITNPLQLRSELETIRRLGYAVDREERELGVGCVASAILDSRSHPKAAISVSGPAVRITSSRLAELGGLVSEAAAELSKRLGFRHPGAQDTQLHAAG